ncbi:MAG: hypothetical protein M1815_002624 [Lichina confinis]|nr:MAG: hypothetical protein M1815_002624 [Lichina confinis]
MPYNTRRKSLSLPSLGIHLPQSSRASAAHRAAQAAAATPATSNAENPPSKRVKRSHSSASAASSPTLSSRQTATPPLPPASRPSRRPASASAYDHTPPPSPRSSTEPRIDTDGIGDEIVVGVIHQLERTGNKPQLVKELAAVLCNSLDSVESSANPQAIISSRLNAYLKRPWSARSPCPLAKTLVPTHPRRIYFYLTTQPHQPLPACSSESPLPSSRRALISPSLSSDDDDHETRKREAMSPSPEVDLSPAPPHPDEVDPDVVAREDVYFDAPPVVGAAATPPGSFGVRTSLGRDASHPDADAMSHRAPSPPLERDEREFTRTASAMQSKRSRSADRRRMALDHADPTTARASVKDDSAWAEAARSGDDRPADVDVVVDTRIVEDEGDGRHSEAAALFLFGQDSPTSGAAATASLSPVKLPTAMPLMGSRGPAAGLHILTGVTALRSGPQLDHADSFALMDLDARSPDQPHANTRLAPSSSSSRAAFAPMSDMSWDGDMRSPEHVELQELEDLLGGF